MRDNCATCRAGLSRFRHREMLRSHKQIDRCRRRDIHRSRAWYYYSHDPDGYHGHCAFNTVKAPAQHIGVADK